MARRVQNACRRFAFCKAGGGFRSAAAGELMVQLDACRDLTDYLLDSPHRVWVALMNELTLSSDGVACGICMKDFWA